MSAFLLFLLQTCDANLIIRHINASYPGALNYAYIFKHSALRKKLREIYDEDPSFWVLGESWNKSCLSYPVLSLDDYLLISISGDSGYANEPWLVIPILHGEEGSPEEFFTKWHCKARCCVKRCIGV